jgi:outer membrane protein assembly factor BamD (BamD/ComL family)
MIAAVWTLAPAGIPVARAAKPYTEELAPEGNRGWLLRPAKDDPTAQLAHAEALLQDGSERAADRQFRALVRTWPTTPEAATAQYHHAAYLQRRGKREKAFEAYQFLVDNYPGRFPYETVLERQFAIAMEIKDHRRGAWFGLPGFSSPERALPMLEDIVRNGPRWERAPEAHFLMGSIREQNKEYDLAVVSYLETMLRYPRSPYAMEAAFARARCLVTMSERTPYDKDRAEEAWYALSVFITSYPDSEYVEEIRALYVQISDRRAERAFEVAQYYDKTADNPDAALTAYRNFLSTYPSSKWTESAQRRITTLEQIVEAHGAE